MAHGAKHKSSRDCGEKAYSDNLSEETRKGMLEKARLGVWP